MSDKELDFKRVKGDITNSFEKLIGSFLTLAEGYFKKGVSNEDWNSFRKIVLDLGNANRRTIESKLEGRNYYVFIPKKKEG